MLQGGIIEESFSEWNNPILIVPKKDGHRFCLDLRKLNSITKTITYRLPIIDDLLAVLDKAQYVTTLDLKSGYWNVPLTDEAKEKTSFTCHLGSYSFARLPFGAKNAGAVFMQLMDTVLRGCNDFAQSYLDDVIIFSQTIQEHKRHIQKVFDRIRAHKLKLKLKKCSFKKKETKYLGFIITEKGVAPDPDKVKAIRNISRPKSAKECRQFVGLINYCRRYLPAFSHTAEPITALTHKFTPFQWSERCEKAFNKLKEDLAIVPMLAHPDTNLPYNLYCDSSDFAIASALCQEGPNNGEFIEGLPNEKPIYFISHKLNRTQQAWPIIEREFFSIYYAIKKLDFYLHSSRFTIYTDNQPLIHFMTSEMKNRRIRNWALSIEGYDFKIKYIRSNQNVVADMLSRALPIEHISSQTEFSDVDENTYEINIINSNQIDTDTQNENENPPHHDETDKSVDFDIVTEQENDAEINKIKIHLKNETADKRTSSKFMIVDNKVYFITEPDNDVLLRLYVPSNIKEKILKAFHDDLGHYGIDKVYNNIKLKYYWPNLYKAVYRYVDRCTTCKVRNLKAQKAPMQHTDIPNKPFYKISIDVAGPFPVSLSGNKYIVYFLDHYSLWPEAFAVPDKTSQTMAQLLLEEIVPRFSVPRILVSDNGAEAMGGPFQETLKELNIKHITTTFYRPQSNGRNERAHITCNDILSKQCAEEPNIWDAYLPFAMASIRCNVNESTKFTPFFLLYGSDPIIPLDNLLQPKPKYKGEEMHKIRLENMHKAFYKMYANVRKAQNRSIKYHDRKAKNTQFQIGDHVYYKNFKRKSKLESKCVPYYVIIEERSPVSFTIKHQVNGNITKAHAAQLRKSTANWSEVKTKTPTQRYKRKATYVVPPLSSTEENSENETTIAKMNKHKQIKRMSRIEFCGAVHLVRTISR